MIAREYDDHRILGTLDQPYTTRMDGRYRSRSRWKRETDTLVLEREYICGIVPLLLRCPNPSRQLALYGHILRDKLSHSRSKKQMMNIQARPLRVSAASEELHLTATRKINTIHQINSDALQTTQNSHR